MMFCDCRGRASSFVILSALRRSKNHQSSIAIQKSDAWGSAFPRARARAPARNRNRSGLHPTSVPILLAATVSTFPRAPARNRNRPGPPPTSVPILCGGSIFATALILSEARIHAVPAAERAVGWFRQFDYDYDHEHDYEQELAPVKIAWSVHSITNYEHEHEQEQEDIEKWKMSNGKCKMTRRDASSVCARHAAKFRNSDSELAECEIIWRHRARPASTLPPAAMGDRE